jgi:hypothetical protein
VPWRLQQKIVGRVWLGREQLDKLFHLMGDRVWKKSWSSPDWIGRLSWRKDERN